MSSDFSCEIQISGSDSSTGQKIINKSCTVKLTEAETDGYEELMNVSHQMIRLTCNQLLLWCLRSGSGRPGGVSDPGGGAKRHLHCSGESEGGASGPGCGL